MRIEREYQKNVGDGYALTAHLRPTYGGNLWGVTPIQYDGQPWVRLYFAPDTNLAELDAQVAAFDISTAPPSPAQERDTARQQFRNVWNSLRAPGVWQALSAAQRDEITRRALVFLLRREFDDLE